jgi:hypothetical protein
MLLGQAGMPLRTNVYYRTGLCQPTCRSDLLHPHPPPPIGRRDIDDARPHARVALQAVDREATGDVH